MNCIVSITADPSPPETGTRPGRDPRMASILPHPPTRAHPGFTRVEVGSPSGGRTAGGPGLPGCRRAGSPCGQSAGRVNGRRMVEGFVGHRVDLGGAAELGQPRRDHRASTTGVSTPTAALRPGGGKAERVPPGRAESGPTMSSSRGRSRRSRSATSRTSRRSWSMSSACICVRRPAPRCSASTRRPGSAQSRHASSTLWRCAPPSPRRPQAEGPVACSRHSENSTAGEGLSPP